MELKFLGRGGAFLPEEGNTSAYFIRENKLFLFDCGETVFLALKRNNRLKKLVEENNIKDIQVYITHRHSDHVGSLSSLIFYCYYILGIRPKVFYPDKFDVSSIQLNRIMQIVGLNGNSLREFHVMDVPDNDIDFIECKHTKNMKCCHYIIRVNDKKIFYSGDCLEVNEEIAPTLKYYDEVYLECSTQSYNTHMTLDKIEEYISLNGEELRDKIYLMHIDSLDLVDQAKEHNLKVVEVEE